MQVICLDEEAFFDLIDRVITYIDGQKQEQNDWISAEKALEELGISSKTTLAKYRDDPDNPIRHSQVSRKLILYYRPSIEEFLQSKIQKF